MFKDIKNYEMLYAVNQDGCVISKGNGNSNNSKPRELKPFLSGKPSNRYLTVRLSKDGVYSDKRVHRLVAEAFIDNPLNHETVNHKNKNTIDNRVSNLEWCTNQYNKEYSASKEYILMSPEGKQVNVFNLSKFCRDNGLSNGCIYHLLSGRYSQHKGWTRFIS